INRNMKLLLVLALAAVAVASPLVKPVVLPEAPLPAVEAEAYVPMVEPVSFMPLYIPNEVVEALKLADAQGVFDSMAENAVEDIAAEAVNFVDFVAEEVAAPAAEEIIPEPV
ncbi:hypothetical protein P5E51_16045, partial [Clostridium perfringens]|nr:hypothetical protein [Clostridium perfringens]